MNSHWPKKLITLLATCVAVVATVVVTIPQSPASAVSSGGIAGLPRRAAAVIAAGENHTCARLADGTVKCWGHNDHGQLGQGDTASRGFDVGTMGDDLPPVDLGAGRTAIAIAAGIGHTCALLDDHTVKCWGSNASGQLGQGDADDRGDGPGELGDNLAAIDLGSGRTATAIATGGYHNCAILDDASVKCWGYNNVGELGQGPVDRIGNDPGEMGDNLPPVNLGTGRAATAIASGLTHNCAILDGGTAKCWGGNTHGQLGLGDTGHRGDSLSEMGDALPAIDLGTGRTAAAVSAGLGHTCASLDDYSLKCWGSNNLGQLGQGDIEARGDEAGEMGDALLPIDLDGAFIFGVAAGGNHTCAVMSPYNVKCWGRNNVGQLGQGNNLPQGDNAGEMGNALADADLGTGKWAWAVTVGTSHSCALLEDLTMKCWGRNTWGQLGRPQTGNTGDGAGEMGDFLPAIDVGTQDAVTAVATGAAHTCAILDDGAVKCWGDNASGKLGLGDTIDQGDMAGQMGADLPAVDLGTGRTATAIAAGGNHTCAILDTGAVKCWGENGTGQLGQGNTSDRGDGPGEMGDNLAPIDLGTGRTATAIAAGAGHTCAVLDDGDIKCWGQNGSGQLAQGDTATRGDGPGEMGDNLDPTNLFPDAVAIAAGQLHTCALFGSGDVFCWGQNVLGQLGQENTNNWGDGGGLEALNPIDLGTGRTAVAIAAGGYHSCAVLDDGTVKCWGANGSGDLGQGDTTTRGDGAGEMGDSLAAIDLGTGRTAINVAAGLEHSCAVLDDGTAKCWGQNAFGQLGRFNTSDMGDGAGEMGDSLAAIDLGTARTATALAGGTDHSCALLDSRALRCWGGNGQGQLGQGDTMARGDNVAEMGFLLPVRLAGNSHVSPIVDVPLPPTDVAAVAGVESATVTWQIPEDGGGRPIQGYQVQSAPAGTTTWTTRTVTVGFLATNALVTGLDAAAVQFRVAAFSVVGASAYSSPSAAVVPAAVPAAPVPAAPLPPGPVGTDLVTVPPARLLDTRGPHSTVDGLQSGGGQAPAGSVTEVQVTGRGGVPGDAVGAILNVTVVGAQAAGFATVFGCTGTIPTASNLNYAGGQTIANNAIVELSPTGSVCVYTDAAAHLLVDVNGYLPAGSHVGTVAPARLLDTRAPNSTIDGLHSGGGPAAEGSITEVQITGRGGVPAAAIAAILNVTVVGPAGDGFATIFPCLTVPPTASNLNYAARRDIPNGAVAQLSPQGTVCVFTDSSAHLLIDVNGYLPSGTSVGTLAPARLLDTRGPNSTVDGLHSGGGPAPAGSVTEVQIAGRGGVPQDATSAILNVTIVGPQADGFATVFDCATGVPTASNVNYTTGRDIPNNTVSKLSPSGTVCLYTDAAADLLVDVNGYA